MTGPPTISVGHTLSGRLPATQYHVEERLGAGGVGAVYRVLEQASGKSLALKVLHRCHAASAALKTRFEREAQALVALSHPNVVQIVDHGNCDGEPYLVMELLLGEGLAERLRRERLSASEVRLVGGELMSALAYVHAEGLVHRDLKPGNIFLQRLDDGRLRCKVLDFGFVKFVEGAEDQVDPLTRSGEILGTPAYMAPEQIGGQATSARTDVYALGVVLFEMVTGKRPFDGDVTDIMRGHLIEDVPSLESVAPGLVPCAGLSALLERALRKRATDRFADAGEMRAAFQALPEPLFELGQVSPRELLEQASTLVAAEAMQRPTPPPERASRGLVAGLVAGLRAFLSRVVRAGAMALIVLSLVVIIASAVTIYGLRDAEGPAGTASPKVLASRLDKTLERTRQAVEGALVDAREATAGAEPSMAPPTPGTEPEPAAAPERGDVEAPEAFVEAPAPAAASGGNGAAAAIAARLPPARDPFRRRLPPELRPIVRMAEAGQRGGERTLARLRAYNRQHPRDARGHLLLARLYWNRDWRGDALAQYEAAARIDPTARGAKHMLAHLRALASQPKTAGRAAALIARLYGPQGATGGGTGSG